MDKENLKMFLKPTSDHRDQLWDGHNAAWWRGKYESYVGNIRRYGNYLRSIRSNPLKSFEIKKLIRHYSKLHEILEKRADLAGLPKKYRSYP